MRQIVVSSIYSVLFVVFGIHILGCTSMRQNAVRWALDRGDFPKAISHMQGLTKNEKYQVINSYCNDNRLKGKEGDAQAACNYAYCVEKGLGDVEADPNRAATFYRFAARNGNMDAIMNLIRLKKPLPRHLLIDDKKHLLHITEKDGIPHLVVLLLHADGQEEEVSSQQIITHQDGPSAETNAL